MSGGVQGPVTARDLDVAWARYLRLLESFSKAGTASCDVLDEISGRAQQLQTVIKGLLLDPGAVKEAADLLAELETSIKALRSIHVIGSGDV